MHFIDIQNGTKTQRKLCKNVIAWYDENFLDDYAFDLTIQHLELDVEHSGFMYVSGNLENPDDFTIEIDKNLRVEEYIMTLIHEMLHIEDYIKGNLTEVNGSRYWNGIYYESEDYENQPWEVRAAELETQYYAEYCNTTREICQVL
jgi:hypothetical protein